MLLIIHTAAYSAEIKVPLDYPTIQAAIDAANSGDTIRVDGAAVYQEAISLKEGVKLIGTSSQTIQKPTIKIPVSSPADTAALYAASDTIIENFIIDGTADTSTSTYAVELNDAANVTINNCSLIGAKTALHGITADHLSLDHVTAYCKSESGDINVLKIDSLASGFESFEWDYYIDGVLMPGALPPATVSSSNDVVTAGLTWDVPSAINASKLHEIKLRAASGASLWQVLKAVKLDIPSDRKYDITNIESGTTFSAFTGKCITLEYVTPNKGMGFFDFKCYVNGVLKTGIIPNPTIALSGSNIIVRLAWAIPSGINTSDVYEIRLCSTSSIMGPWTVIKTVNIHIAPPEAQYTYDITNIEEGSALIAEGGKALTLSLETKNALTSAISIRNSIFSVNQASSGTNYAISLPLGAEPASVEYSCIYGNVQDLLNENNNLRSSPEFSGPPDAADLTLDDSSPCVQAGMVKDSLTGDMGASGR